MPQTLHENILKGSKKLAQAHPGATTVIIAAAAQLAQIVVETAATSADGYVLFFDHASAASGKCAISMHTHLQKGTVIDRNERFLNGITVVIPTGGPELSISYI